MIRIVLLTTALAASTALAHANVSNPAVKARMDLMSQIGANTKVLGDMAKGATAFDAARAQAAAAAIATHAANTPAAFQAQEDDPESEAKPAIWSNFGDFTAKSQALRAAATKASGEITSMNSLRASLGAIGGTCKSCHEDYRE